MTAEHWYMVAAIAGGIGILYLIIRKGALKNTRVAEALSNLTHAHNKHNEKLDDLDRKARKIFKEFQLWMHPESPYNHQQRRRIKRHYMKFLYRWYQIPKSKRDVDKIIYYLVHLGPHNKYVVDGYLKTEIKEKK